MLLTEAKDFVDLHCRVSRDLVMQKAEKHFVGANPAWRVRLSIEMRILPAMLSFRCRIGGVSVGLGRIKYRPTHTLDGKSRNRGVTNERLLKTRAVSPTTNPHGSERRSMARSASASAMSTRPNDSEPENAAPLVSTSSPVPDTNSSGTLIDAPQTRLAVSLQSDRQCSWKRTSPIPSRGRAVSANGIAFRERSPPKANKISSTVSLANSDDHAGGS